MKATLLTARGQQGWATVLNDRDQVVGIGTDVAAPYTTHGMPWATGHAYDPLTLVDHPEGWTALSPLAIGPDGTIACSGTGTHDSVPTYFVLEPIQP